MKIKLNYDLLKYKKNTIIDLDKVNINEKVYFEKRLKDSEIDNCIEIINKNVEKKQENKKDSQ